MHRFLRFSGVILLAAGAVACGGGASAPVQSGPAAVAQPTAAAQPAGALKPAQPSLAQGNPLAGGSKQISMGTTQASSAQYAFWVAAAKVINTKVTGLNATPVETGASVENVNRMGKDEFDLGLLTADVSYRAWKGIGPWEGKAIDNHRVALVYDENPNAYVVREDSGVKKPEDLNGKDFNAGMRGSATENMTKLAFESLGIKPKYYVGGTEDALGAIKDKRIAGYAKSQAGKNVDATVLDLMTSTPIRVIGFSKEQQDKVIKDHPYYAFTRIEANTFKADWNKDPIDTLGVFVQMAMHKRITTDQGYQMVKAIIEDNKEGGEGVIASAYPSVKGHDLVERTLKFTNSPLHAGVEKYFKELGKTIPEAIRSPEAK
ncbi:MAG: TAXI family TRAP transporter solute-binding subunit [Chloroflexi bacterium]|nr:TAXI family TRAP transporter solute-binding subunit [Chloroflexota bacterium]